MNVSCPDCRSIFRVDPAKVPPSGVRARCSVCSGVISIPAPTGQPTPGAGAARPAAPAAPPPQARTLEAPAAPRQRPESIERATVTATATPPSSSSGLREFSPPSPPAPVAPPASTGVSGASAPPFVPSAPPSRPPAPSSPPARPAAAMPVTVDGGPRRPLNPFLSKDPNQRAKRLARALVSDIITYHPATHAEGLRDGTLKQLFREEIKKSFEEYIAQVGQQLAESTTYFQEALNEVLGAGKKIF